MSSSPLTICWYFTKIRDERKCSLDCENSLPSHREVKALSQTPNCTSEVLSIPPETEGPRWRRWTPLLFDRTSSACKQVFSPSSSLRLSRSVPLLALFLPLLHAKVSGGGGSFDYLCCRLIAFLNLCTDVLLHCPGACRMRPPGPLPGAKKNKKTNQTLCACRLPITDLHSFILPRMLSQTSSVCLLCLCSS